MVVADAESGQGEVAELGPLDPDVLELVAGGGPRTFDDRGDVLGGANWRRLGGLLATDIEPSETSALDVLPAFGQVI